MWSHWFGSILISRRKHTAKCPLNPKEETVEAICVGLPVKPRVSRGKPCKCWRKQCKTTMSLVCDCKCKWSHSMMSRWLLTEPSHFINPPFAADLTPQLLSQSPVISGQMRRSKGAVSDVIYPKQKQTKGKWGKLGHPRDDGVRRNELKFQLPVQSCLWRFHRRQK